MKVLIIEHFSSGNMYTSELCDKLSKYVDINLLTVENSLIDNKKYNYNKVLYGHENSGIKKIIKYIKGLNCIIKEIIFNKYDVVHVQTFDRYNVEILLYKLLKFRINKLVFTVHNVLPHEENKKHYRYFKLMYDNSNTLIVHNNLSMQILMKKFSIKDEKISVIPHGIYNSYIPEGSNINYQIKNNRIINILLIGSIRKYKGIDILIKALSILPQHIKNKINIIIAGKQNMKLDNTDYKKMIQELDVSNFVKFINKRLDDKDLIKLYKQADVCIFPYKQIYGSGALLMSYTFGVPVIVSDTPAFIEETENGKTGLIFKNNDYIDLANKIIDFVNSDYKKIVNYKNNIKNLVDSKYNWELSALKTYKVYQK